MGECQKCGAKLNQKGECLRCAIEATDPFLGAMFKMMRGETLTLPEMMRFYGAGLLLVGGVLEQQAKRVVDEAEKLTRDKEGKGNG